MTYGKTPMKRLRNTVMMGVAIPVFGVGVLAVGEVELATKAAEAVTGKSSEFVVSLALVIMAGALLGVIWKGFEKIDLMIKSGSDQNLAWIQAQNEQAKAWREEVRLHRDALERLTVTLEKRPCASSEMLTVVKRLAEVRQRHGDGD